MKKFTTLILMLMSVTLAFGQLADEYFAPVGWGSQPRNTDFSAEPANESLVMIPMANEGMDGSIDISAWIADDVKNVWDRIGSPNLIAGETSGEVDPFDLDDAGEGTFGATWKAFYDSDALYVILKFVDSDAQASDRHYELGLQTKEYERYEAGFQAASAVDTTGVGFELMNDQYGAFKELGGMKIVIDQDGTISGNQTSLGSEGSWVDAIGGTGVADAAVLQEADGTLWHVVELAFDDLQYFVDEWGADEGANYASMDPTVETVISFEPSARATIGTGEEAPSYVAWWNGVNDAYKLVYYQGKLEFGTSVFNPVGIATDKTRGTMAYIYKDMLRLKGYDQPVDLEVYSIIGQKVLTAENVSGDLNVSSLQDGVYIVRVADTKEAFKVMK